MTIDRAKQVVSLKTSRYNFERGAKKQHFHAFVVAPSEFVFPIFPAHQPDALPMQSQRQYTTKKLYRNIPDYSNSKIDTKNLAKLQISMLALVQKHLTNELNSQ